MGPRPALVRAPHVEVGRVSFTDQVEVHKVRRRDGTFCLELYFEDPAIVHDEDPATGELESRLRDPDLTLTEDAMNKLVVEWLRPAAVSA